MSRFREKGVTFTKDGPQETGAHGGMTDVIHERIWCFFGEHGCKTSAFIFLLCFYRNRSGAHDKKSSILNVR